MNISNLYRKLKQILNDSNQALISKGLNSVDNLYDIASEIGKYSINRLPYGLQKNIVAVTTDDLSGVTTIGDYVFYYCNSLTSITIPDNVTTIGNYAFQNCTGLESVIIPNSVITICRYAFNGCDNLTDIYLNPTTPPALGNTSTIPIHTTIHVPIGSGDVYKSATNWSSYADRIVEDIEIAV